MIFDLTILFMWINYIDYVFDLIFFSLIDKKIKCLFINLILLISLLLIFMLTNLLVLLFIKILFYNNFIIFYNNLFFILYLLN